MLLGTGALVGATPADTGNRRDPFVPLITAEGKRLDFPQEQSVDDAERLGRLTFQGIVLDPTGGSYAIINGKVVHEQDEIEGMKIVEIEPNIVTVLVEGKRHQLVLHPIKEEASTEP